MHEVLVNRLGGLSLPRKSVVRLTDRPDMTLDVYHGCKTTMQQQQPLKPSSKLLKVSELQYGTVYRIFTLNVLNFLTLLSLTKSTLANIVDPNAPDGAVCTESILL